MPDIGKRIRLRREQLSITQEELAQKLGYKNKSTIAKIENGTNDIVQSKVVEFATFLDTSVAYLMGWEEEKEVQATKDGNSGNDYYYLNDETREIAQEAFENPELRTLFKVARDISPERLKAHIEFMRSLKEQEKGNNDEGC